jgi:hypothetical protein
VETHDELRLGAGGDKDTGVRGHYISLKAYVPPTLLQVSGLSEIIIVAPGPVEVAYHLVNEPVYRSKVFDADCANLALQLSPNLSVVSIANKNFTS